MSDLTIADASRIFGDLTASQLEEAVTDWRAKQTRQSASESGQNPQNQFVQALSPTQSKLVPVAAPKSKGKYRCILEEGVRYYVESCGFKMTAVWDGKAFCVNGQAVGEEPNSFCRAHMRAQGKKGEPGQCGKYVKRESDNKSLRDIFAERFPKSHS